MQHVTTFAVFFGYWSGTTFSLTPVCVASVCKIEDYGKKNGTTYSISSIGARVGIPITGTILEANGGSVGA